MTGPVYAAGDPDLAAGVAAGAARPLGTGTRAGADRLGARPSLHPRSDQRGRRCPHRLHDTLAQIVRAELIYRRGTPPDAEYTFKHALVQDAAYGTLLRAAASNCMAELPLRWKNRFPKSSRHSHELLAQHCTDAGLAKKAIELLSQGGPTSDCTGRDD